jgi:hypothetical protein
VGKIHRGKPAMVSIGGVIIEVSLVDLMRTSSSNNPTIEVSSWENQLYMEVS